MAVSFSDILKDVSKLEVDGDLVSALRVLEENKNDSEFKDVKFMFQMNIDRLLLRINNLASEYFLGGDAIYEHPRNPRTYAFDSKGLANKELLPIISLTTISTRIDRVLMTIDCIKKQSTPIHSINLYISDKPYLLDEGIDRNHPILLELYKLGVNIYNVSNTGPYRKQYPVIYQLKASGAPAKTPIITIDDDVLYPEDIVEKLVCAKDSLSAVVSHRGRQMILGQYKMGQYKEFKPPLNNLDYLNLGTGKNGILYRLDFFSDKFEEYVGPIIAPTADDLWCKWVTALKCIPTIIVEPNAAYEPSLDFKESAPEDKVGLFHKFNAKGRNDVAISNLETYFSLLGNNLFSIYSRKFN